MLLVAPWHFHCCQECSKYSGFVLKQRRTWCDFPFSSWGWSVFDQVLSCVFYSVNHCCWFFLFLSVPFRRSRAVPTGWSSCVLSSVLFPFGAQRRRCLFEHPPLLIRLDNCSHLRHLTHPNNTCALPSCSVFILGFAFLLFFDSFLTGVCWWSCRLRVVRRCAVMAQFLPAPGLEWRDLTWCTWHVSVLLWALSRGGFLFLVVFFNSLRCHTL